MTKDYQKARDDAKRLRQGRLMRGLCGMCGARPFATGKTACEGCLQMLRDNAAERRTYRRKHKLCYHCGGPRDRPTTVCTRCYKPKRNEYPEDRKARRAAEAEARRLQREAERDLIRECLPLIPKRWWREAVSLRHGLTDGYDHSLEDVGREFSVTRERIRQIEFESFALMGIDRKTYERKPPLIKHGRKRGPKLEATVDEVMESLEAAENLLTKKKLDRPKPVRYHRSR